MSEASRHIKVLCRVMPSYENDSCILSCSEARSIIASNKPITKHLLYEKSQKNLNALKSSLLEDSTLIKFDGIVEESMSQSKFFNEWLKMPTQDLIIGKSLTVLVFGTTGSGKSFTIRGGEGKKRGLALRSVELLLTIAEKQKTCIQIKASVAAIFEEKVIDLLNKQGIAHESLISKTSDFHATLNQALKNRKSIGERHHKDKIHMVVRVRLYQGNEVLSEAHFVELAGSEYAREDKQIARSFNSISNRLTQSSLSWQSNSLCNFLDKGLDIYGDSPCQVFLICCASQDSENFQDTLASLKFTSRIKECIEKDNIKPDLMHIDNILFILDQSSLEDAEKILESMTSTLKKLVDEEKNAKNREFLSKHKQIQKETLFDIEEAKTKSIKNAEEPSLLKALQDLSQLKANYLLLQDQYNTLLEEKTQISSNYLQFHSKIVEELLHYIRQLSQRLAEESEIRNKIITESKNIRHNILNKTNDREDLDCNCEEEVRVLHKNIKDLSEDRKKLMEKLENCLKENKNKEEHIQALNSASGSYEQETQHLSSVISDYENLIYELRKSLNSMSFKINQIEEEKLLISQENERLRNHYRGLKEKIDEQKMITEKEIFKYKQETDDFTEKYEISLAKIESLTIELSKAKLSNNHLKIQNKSLVDDLNLINYAEIDKRVKKVYEKIDKFKEVTACPVLFDNM